MIADVKRVNSYFDDKYLLYQPALAIIFDSVSIALIISSLLYWKDMGAKKGLVYKTVNEMWIDTGLSESQQRTAINKCKKLGILRVELRGIPAKRHFSLDTAALINYITSSDKTTELVLRKHKLETSEISESITESTTLLSIKVRTLYEKFLKSLHLKAEDEPLTEKRRLLILRRCIDTDYGLIVAAIEAAGRHPDANRRNGYSKRISLERLFRSSQSLVKVAKTGEVEMLSD